MRIMNTSLLHKAMWELRVMLIAGSTIFELSEEEKEPWRCYPNVTSYFCDILEQKDMLCMKHSTTLKRPCVICFVRMESVHI